ncbi:hypothetical protein HFC70_00040 [Agrobacterium sp. a22-2]|uniref:DUF6460 domain-containing protein n=1 Tax=Agrobacterium sp. a22-2 TaxID=2283840 RepID=UPI00144521A5|nr:DUF6460 domain-containing protein [Agrobacterium sp. a22-2]NKN34737.1 hypothetical protein [Agrobacterium sp. a22-2]
MFRILTAVFKIALASLLAGAALTFFGFTADNILAFFGATQAEFWAGLQRTVDWSLPRAALGSLVVVPIWLLTYILSPPRDL